ncbi:MAG: DUF4870 domain-containing protein [Anaerolineae bacterium]
MTDQTQNPFDLGAGGAPTDDEKLWSLLSYLTGGLIGLIMLLTDKGKQSQFIRHNAITSLGLVVTWIAAWIVVAILSIIPGVACIAWIILFVPAAFYIYYGIQAYQGKDVEVPYLSEFMRKQGWL